MIFDDEVSPEIGVTYSSELGKNWGLSRTTFLRLLMSDTIVSLVLSLSDTTLFRKASFNWVKKAILESINCKVDRFCSSLLMGSPMIL